MNNIERRIKLIEAENACINKTHGFEKMFEYIPERPDEATIPGVYVRSLFIPAGALIFGKIHNTEHIVTLQGDIIISDEFGDNHYTGFNMFVSPRGIKRIVRAIGDTRFTTIHHVPDADKMSFEDIENRISFTNYFDFENALEFEQQELLECA